MSAETRYEEQLNCLLEAYFQEMQAMSDKEILAGEAASAVRGRALARIERAAQEAGRRRMAAGKAGRQATSAGTVARRDLSLSDARAYIARVANDAQYTLAARQLDDMSEDEIFQLYEHILELEARNRS
jgi:hypothetical protein